MSGLAWAAHRAQRAAATNNKDEHFPTKLHTQSTSTHAPSLCSNSPGPSSSFLSGAVSFVPERSCGNICDIPEYFVTIPEPGSIRFCLEELPICEADIRSELRTSRSDVATEFVSRACDSIRGSAFIKWDQQRAKKAKQDKGGRQESVKDLAALLVAYFRDNPLRAYTVIRTATPWELIVEWTGKQSEFSKAGAQEQMQDLVRTHVKDFVETRLSGPGGRNKVGTFRVTEFRIDKTGAIPTPTPISSPIAPLIPTKFEVTYSPWWREQLSFELAQRHPLTLQNFRVLDTCGVEIAVDGSATGLGRLETPLNEDELLAERFPLIVWPDQSSALAPLAVGLPCLGPFVHFPTPHSAEVDEDFAWELALQAAVFRTWPGYPCQTNGHESPATPSRTERIASSADVFARLRKPLPFKKSAPAHVSTSGADAGRVGAAQGAGFGDEICKLKGSAAQTFDCAGKVSGLRAPSESELSSSARPRNIVAHRLGRCVQCFRATRA